MNNDKFYNILAEDYNSMIPLDKQIESKTTFFKHFINENTKTAADLGAGSGADSIALTKLELKVSAIEPSSEMIKQAKTNFAKHNVEIGIHNKKIFEIDESFHNSFDLVVSLGNTLANINKDEIDASIVKVIALLNEGGKAIIQILNYDKILKEKERIVNITESSDKQFIRFYDFIGEQVFFNLLSFNKTNYTNRQLITTEIFPYTKENFEMMLGKRKYSNIEFFGDMKFGKFDAKTSNNLIIILQK